MSDGEERKKGVEAEREPNFLLAPFERRFLPWAARHLPRWVLPDDMTALGVLAALGVCAAYQVSNNGRGWLWVASALATIPLGTEVSALAQLGALAGGVGICLALEGAPKPVSAPAG